MSIAAMAWAWRQETGGTDKLVLLALADHADDTGVCWPGKSGVAEKCGLGRRTVVSAVQRLVEAGLVSSQQRFREDGSRTSDLIRLLVDVPSSAPPPADAAPPPVQEMHRPPAGDARRTEPSVETTSKTEVLEGARKRKPRKLIDQGTLPEMPGELHHAAHLSLSILHGVWKKRGGLEPTLHGVGLAVLALPDRDHVAVAHGVEHWLSSGNGREADCGDIVRRFRNFLKGTVPSAPQRPGNGNVVPMRPSVIDRMNRFELGYPQEGDSA